MRISYIERYMKEIGHDITHSTIIHGIRRAKRVMYEDDGYKDIIKKIESDAV
jgi:chromosomal replication initiation ATPase DnaA